MKTHYLKPSLEVVEIQQHGDILIVSINNVQTNTNIDYGGGNVVTPMARKVDLWEEDDSWEEDEE